jgi:hypothetical protein
MQTYVHPHVYQLEGDLRQYDISPEEVHVDQPLANILLNYRPTGFIADQILPVVTVAKQSDIVPGIKIDDRFRIEQTIRAPGTEPRMVHFNVTSQQYFAPNYALGTFLTAEEMANTDACWNTRQIRSELVWDLLMLDYEKRVADMVNSGSNCGSYWVTASAWSDAENSTPLTNALDDLDVAEDLRGIRPNKIVFGKYAWRKWRNSDEVLARLFPHGGGQGAIVSTQMAAALLEVDQVIVGGVYYNSAAENATLALTKVWNDNVLYYYSPGKPSKERPSFGYSFRWAVPGMPNMTVRTFPFDAKVGRQDIHIGYYQDELLTDKYLGCLRTGVGSSQ